MFTRDPNPHPRPLPAPATSTLESRPATFRHSQAPDWVPRISSDRDDRMGAKIKTQKNPMGFKKNQKTENHWTKIYPPKNPMPNFQAIMKISRKHKMI